MTSLKALMRRHCETKAIALLVAVVLYLVVAKPTVFASYGVVLVNLATTGLVAVGLTVVVAEGEIDLSVGSVVAISGAILARFSLPLPVTITLAVAAGVAVGLCNWALVWKVGVSSFIATLGTMIAGSGLALVLTGNQEMPIPHPQLSITFAAPLIGPVTPTVLTFLIGAVVMHVLLSRSRVGREVYAVGGNRRAAHDAGIAVSRRLLGAFVVSSTGAAVVGVCQTLSLGTAEPSAGSNVLLLSLAAVVIGGASLSGGSGSIVGTVIAATSLAALQTGLNFSGITGNSEEIFVGLALLATVVIERKNLEALRLDIVVRRLRALSR